MLLSELGALQNVVFLGRDIFKIICVYRKDSSLWWPKPVYQQKICDFCLIYTSKHILSETYNFMWLFQTFLRFWKQKMYMIWWNFIVRHCIFSHLEEKHSTLFPHMEIHPNFLNFCKVIPYSMRFPMNQHLGYLPRLLSLTQIEYNLIWWRRIVKWK